MHGPDSRRTEPTPPVAPAPSLRGRRRRQLIEAAVVSGEMTAALIADSRDLIARSHDLIARPHMAVNISADPAPPARQTIVCEQCGLGIDTPGVAIMRGRNVMHVRCA